MATLLFIIVFLICQYVSAELMLGCDSAEKETDMTIDATRSRKYTTTFNFIRNYHVLSPEDCFEECCNTGDCNIATFHFAREEKNCIHLTCLPLEACIYRESNETVIAKLYRIDNKTDIIDNLTMDDGSELMIGNYTDINHVFSYQNMSETLIQEKVNENFSSLLALNYSSEHSFNNETQLSVMPDMKSLERIFSKFVSSKSPILLKNQSFENISYEATSAINTLASEQPVSKPSVKKELEMPITLTNNLTTSKENLTETGKQIKWEVPGVNASLLIPINTIIPTSEHIYETTVTRRPLNQSDSKDVSTENFIRAKKELSEKYLLIIVASMGAATVLIVAVLIGKHFRDSWQRRHYSKMDYLVDGMYNWNDDIKE